MPSYQKVQITGISLSWLVLPCFANSSCCADLVIWYINYTDIKVSTNAMLVIESISGFLGWIVLGVVVTFVCRSVSEKEIVFVNSEKSV